MLLNSAALITEGRGKPGAVFIRCLFTARARSPQAVRRPVRWSGTAAGQRVSQTFTPTTGTLTCTVTGSVLNARLEAGSFVTSILHHHDRSGSDAGAG